ncbi:hypothetical protein KAX02_00765 [candidate division WOR-3 bacterium]|nr:hypothetical protein [candidate division WOR-3 bacterium]
MGFINNNRGTTLVEVLLVAAIGAVIAIVVVAVHISQERIYVGEDTLIRMFRNTTSAMLNMTKVLRMAGYNPTESSIFDNSVSYGGSDSIEVVIDYNGNGALDGLNEIVTYSLNDFAPWGIDSLAFIYLNRRHDTLPRPVLSDSLQSINSILVTVVMRRDNNVAGPERYELAREIKIRN